MASSKIKWEEFWSTAFQKHWWNWNVQEPLLTTRGQLNTKNKNTQHSRHSTLSWIGPWELMWGSGLTTEREFEEKRKRERGTILVRSHNPDRKWGGGRGAFALRETGTEWRTGMNSGQGLKRRDRAADSGQVCREEEDTQRPARCTAALLHCCTAALLHCCNVHHATSR